MEYSKYIEYTNLKWITSKEVITLAKVANEYNYLGVCSLPGNTLILKKKLNPDKKVITVVGFPSPNAYEKVATSEDYRILLGFYVKREIDKVISIIDENVADELDMIFPIAMFRFGKRLRAVKLMSSIKKRFKKPLKVIIELGTLLKVKEDLIEVDRMLTDSGVDFLKTNSGLIKQEFTYLSAFIQIMQGYTKLPIKASGGIKTLEQVESLIKLGVARIGTSSII